MSFELAFNLRCPGQYFDAETGKHYNYFRDYDASIGRYIQSDPIGLDAGPATYAYSENTPMSRIDPYGLSSSGPAFNPDHNLNPAWLKFNNCYSYATGKSGGKPGGTQPGSASGQQFKSVTCKDLLAAAKADGAIEPGAAGACGGTCPTGYHKIKLVITDNLLSNDYHFFRQDSDGSWSSKRGGGAAGRHGMGCPGVPYFDYKIDCGVLCVKH